MYPIPPTISYFNEISKKIRSTREGILCMKSASSVSKKLEVPSKTSRENKERKSMNTMERILGVQKINLFVFFIFWREMRWNFIPIGLEVKFYAAAVCFCVFLRFCLLLGILLSA